MSIAKTLIPPKAKAGDELASGAFFLGWDGIEDRNQNAVECLTCHGFSEAVDPTPIEIRSELNCGRRWACCCAAFVCKSCGKRWVGHRPAPEMG